MEGEGWLEFCLSALAFAFGFYSLSLTPITPLTSHTPLITPLPLRYHSATTHLQSRAQQ